MNPAERWNSLSKVAAIALAISTKARGTAGDQHSSLTTLVGRVEAAAALLQEQLHDEESQTSGYIIDVNKGRHIATEELTDLWSAIQELDACAELPKAVGDLICDFNDLSEHLLKEASGNALCATPSVSNAYMQSDDIRDLGFLHELIRDGAAQTIAQAITNKIAEAAVAISHDDSTTANTCLSAVRDSYVELRQHLRDNYPASMVEVHCAAIDQRLRFFEV